MKNKKFLLKWDINRIIYIITIVISVLFLYAGNRIAMTAGGSFPVVDDGSYIKAKVVSIISKEEVEEPGLADMQTVTSVYIEFYARGVLGEHKGSILQAEQTVGGVFDTQAKEVAPGDSVILVENSDPFATTGYYFSDYQRSDGIAVFCLVFLILLVIFGRMKGVNTILSLMFTCAAVFLVFVPLVLAGYDIYFCSALVCIYVVVSTLLLVEGMTAKTLTAIVGCAAGIFTAGAIGALMSHWLHLSGQTSQESMFLVDLGGASPIDLRGVVFAAIIIGSMGAVMDVAMSVASALGEISSQAIDISTKALFKSGLNIGRDMMSTMANTLVLAYIGSSLTNVLLLTSYSKSLFELLNREMIITEILQAVTGSMAILLTIPLTSLIAAILYTRRVKAKQQLV